MWLGDKILRFTREMQGIFFYLRFNVCKILLLFFVYGVVQTCIFFVGTRDQFEMKRDYLMTPSPTKEEKTHVSCAFYRGK